MPNPKYEPPFINVKLRIDTSGTNPPIPKTLEPFCQTANTKHHNPNTGQTTYGWTLESWNTINPETYRWTLDQIKDLSKKHAGNPKIPPCTYQLVILNQNGSYLYQKGTDLGLRVGFLEP